MNKKFRLFALFVFIIISWGISWPINKIGLSYLSPLWYTAIRLIVGTVTMMSIVIAIKKFTWPHVKDYPLIIIVGILQITLYIFLVNIGLAYLPPGRASLLAYTTPLWIMPIATLFFHEKSTTLRWLGFSLGMLGLIILLSPWQLNWTNEKIILGASMLLLASFCWAISMLCVRYMHWTKTPLELIPWQLLIGTIPILIYAGIKEPLPLLMPIAWNAPLILSLLYTGILVTGISYWSGMIINKELPTTIVSLGFLSVPVFSMIISALFMHEIISLPEASAIGLILAGLICIVI